MAGFPFGAAFLSAGFGDFVMRPGAADPVSPPMTMSPYALDYTTLLTGSYWSGAEVTGQPVILTYSFLAAKPSADPHGLGAALNTFTACSAPRFSPSTPSTPRPAR